MRTIRLIACLAILIALATGCAPSRTDQAAADSAATIYEAAEAIRRGAPPADPVEVIEKNAVAIIHALGLVYPPVERAPAPPTP